MLNIINFATFQELLREAEQRIIDLAKKTIAEKGWFTLALSGGSTPAPLYARLAEADLPWDKIHLFWGDERLVPLDSEWSNYRMIDENLLSKITIPEENIHIPLVDLPPETAAEYYAKEIKQILIPDLKTLDLPTFDCILLGIGPDGHTASLFPDSPALAEKAKLVVAVPHPTTVKPAVPRISFSFPLINSGKRIMFLTTGKEKLKIFDSEVKYPFQMVENADILFTIHK